jgi:diguanylate cyclase (GGDEF)-like protein
MPPRWRQGWAVIPFLRREPLRALRLVFLLALMLAAVAETGQAAAAHRSVGLLAGVLAGLVLLRTAEVARAAPVPFAVDLLELVALAAVLVDVGAADPLLAPLFFLLLCRCAVAGPRRILPLLIGYVGVLLGVSVVAGVPLFPGAVIGLPVMSGLVYAMRTLLVRLQDQDRQRNALLNDVLSRLPFPVVVTGAAGEVVLANPAAAALAGPLGGLRTYLGDGTRVDLRQLPPAEGGTPLRLVRENGGEAVVLAETVSGDGHTVIALHDVTDRQRYEERLRHAAHYDALTGLANRALLWEQFAAVAGGQYAVLVLDLDCFKQVNDTFGHRAGDDLLRGVAQRLQHVCGTSATVARLGGDEFAVLLPQAGAEHARAAEAAMRSCFSWDFPLCTGPIRAGGSIGYAVSAPGYSPEEVLAAADAAMYQQKRGSQLTGFSGAAG